MGICSSCEAVSVASSHLHRPTTTAKLIHQDGRLQEFACPVKVSYVLQKLDDPTNSFICNSDDMDFDDVVTAVGHHEDLHPGQLYFVLPRNRLSQPFPPEEMAALAVKASAALMKNGGGAAGGIGDFCGCRSLKPGVFVEGGKCGDESGVVVGGGGRKMRSSGGGNGRRGGGAVGKRRKVFTANLSTIQEVE